MSKANLIEFTKSLFLPKNKRSLERAALPNPLIVGFIFMVMFVIAMGLILL